MKSANERGIKISVIFLGKNKPFVIKALEFLIENGVTVNAIISEPEHSSMSSKNDLIKTAKEFEIVHMTKSELERILEKNQVENKIFNNVDLVISYLYPKKIDVKLIELPKIGCINFHPAPLPEFRGVSPYCFGILEDFPYWGVTAHFIDKEFDAGDIIKVKKFDVNLKMETSLSLEQKSQIYLFDLFKEITKMFLENKQLPREKQNKGRYFSYKEFEKLREIKENDSIETINKKIRAFWYPPFPGASIKIQGKEYSVINEKILDDVSKNKN